MPATVGTLNTFATQSGNVPASQLDANFAALKTALVGGGGVAAATLMSDVAFGNFSRLTFLNATTIQLGLGVIPIKASSVWTLRPVTGAISLGNGGLSASQLNYVYAFDNAGSTTLEASTTTHATDATLGVEIKSGDATRTLVGMIRTNASSQFEDDNSLRGVVSWFNRRDIGLVNGYTANRTTTSATYVEPASGSEIRGNFVTWADEAVLISFSGGALASAAVTSNIALSIDGSTTPEDAQSAFAVTVSVPQGLTLVKHGLSEGFHFATVLGAIAGGNTLTILGGAAPSSSTPTSRSTLTVKIRG